MRRSPLKKTRTKLRRHQNPELVKQYRLDNAQCELCRYTQSPTKHCVRTALECHHIFFPPRWDLVSNLIMLCPSHHEWATEFTHDQRIHCLYVKLLKGELNIEELDMVAGRKVLGYIELQRGYHNNMSPTYYYATRILERT